MTGNFDAEASAGIEACIEFRFSGAEPGVYHLSITEQTCRKDTEV
jgi:hypothetical protein